MNMWYPLFWHMVTNSCCDLSKSTLVQRTQESYIGMNIFSRIKSSSINFSLFLSICFPTHAVTQANLRTRRVINLTICQLLVPLYIHKSYGYINQGDASISSQSACFLIHDHPLFCCFIVYTFSRYQCLLRNHNSLSQQGVTDMIILNFGPIL